MIIRTETDSWNRILISLSSNGSAPPPGSPEHITADACATTMSKRRALSPRILNVRALVGEAAWGELVRDAKRASAHKREHFGRCIADASDSVISALLCADLRSSLGNSNLAPTRDAEATYLFYQGGQGLPIHLDNDSTFEFNLLISIDSTSPAANQRGSATYFYLGNDNVKATVIKPGFGIWFHASTTPHGRTPLGQEEKITLLSLGLKLEGAAK